MRTTIVIQTETRDKLKRYGRKDQTYDDILQELLKNMKEEKN